MQFNKTFTLKKLLVTAILLSASLLCIAQGESVHAGMNPGGGGADNTDSVGGGSGCGQYACPGTMWVYYSINDNTKSVTIGSAVSQANSITINDCKGYEGIWVLQYMPGGSAAGTLWYKAMTGARKVSSIIRYKGPDGTSSTTQTPKKGVYNDINENVTPYVYNYPACASNSNSQNWTCNVAGGDWMVTRDYVRNKFIENNDYPDARCTINGTYYADCFSSNSPLTYFCYNKPKPAETKNTSIKSSVDVGGITSCDGPGSCTGATASYTGTYNVADYTMSFNHRIKFPAPSNYTVGDQSFHYKVERSTDGGAYTAVEESNASITPSSSFTSVSSHNVSVSLSSYGASSTICERLTVYPKSITFRNSGATPDNGTLTRTICGKVTRPQPAAKSKNTGVKSAVTNNGTTRCSAAGHVKSGTDCNSTTYTFEGGSNVSSYSVQFAHHMIFPTPATGDFYSSSDNLNFTYTIAQKVDSGSYTTLTDSGATGTATLAADGNYHSTFSHTANLTIDTDTTVTVCERITATPKTYTFHEDGATPTASTDSVSTEICTAVHRPAPTPVAISATSTAVADGTVVTDPDTPLYSTAASRTVDFGHAFTHNGASTLSLPTNYSVQYTVDGVRQTDSEHCATNQTACDTTVPSNAYGQLTISLNPGDVKKVCSRVSYRPTSYLIHTDGSQVVDNNERSYSNWACVTFGRPGIREVNDGTITINSESSASLTGDAVWSTTYNAYIMTGTSATVNYSHRLYRGNVTYTDNSHTASPSVTVKYSLGTSQPADFTNATSATIANNGEQTAAGSETVGEIGLGTIVNKCQSIYYAYQQYTLRASYYYVGETRYTGAGGNTILYPPLAERNPGAVEGLVSGTVGTAAYEFSTTYARNVGASTPGCVAVTRPYNFNITSIDVNAETTANITIPANTGQEVEAKYTIHVGKNDPNYMLTDVPNSDIKLISFVLHDTPANGALAGGKTTGGASPCSFFTSKLGSALDEDSCSDTTSAGQLHDHNGTSYYNTNNYTISQSYPTVIPNLPTNKKYCLAIAVQPTSSNPNGSYGFVSPTNTLDTNYTVSNAICYNVGKYPTMQVWGGSTYSSGNISTSVTSVKEGNANRIFGSWDDFMIIAKGSITNTASGATLISGNTNFTSCTISPLTVANSSACQDHTDDLGHSSIEIVDRILSGIKNRYIDGTSEYVDLATAAEVQGTSRVITTAVRNSGLSYYPIVLYNSESDKNVYIANDLDIGFNSRTYKNFVIPQIIIYTPTDIYIDPAVGRIDAWLLAGGEIYTCADASGNNIRTSADSGRCENRLTVTGPTVAQKIHFDRTYGGDAYVDPTLGSSTIKEPAEIFDLNPGAYLFGANEATDDAQPIVTYLHELPPRY